MYNYYRSSINTYKTEEVRDGKFYCKHCGNNKNECRLIFDVEFVCQENLGSENIVKLHINTFDDEGVHNYLILEKLLQ